MAPKISVILPAYNRADSIQVAVESVLRQTWQDFELIIVDDCSTDGTVDAIQAMTDPRIKCLSTPQNMGPSGARNTGLHAASGDWVAFQDSDDEWLPEKLAQQMARLEARGMVDIGAYCGMVIVGLPDQAQTGGRTQARYHPDTGVKNVEGDLSTTLMHHSLISTQTLMARRETLLKIDGFDEALPALVDWECVIRLSLEGSFAFVDTPLVLQNFSQNSVTKDRWRRAEARRRILETHHSLMAKHPDALARHWRSVAGDERRLGRFSDARQALAQARQLRPMDPAIWALSAMIFTKKDKKP